MKKYFKNLIFVLVASLVFALSSCGTGKRCDCPSFSMATEQINHHA